jgi:DNA-binding MarR family transcriptional regulator
MKNDEVDNNSILWWENFQCIAEANFGSRSVSVSDIYLSLGISKNTAIRCVTLLENLEILEKSRDRNGRRHAVITLNEERRTESVGYLDYINSELVEITSMQPESRS